MKGSNRIRLIRARARSDAEQSQSVAAKAVGYIRVSTEEQAVNAHNLQVQERTIRAFAESQGYELLDVIADPGISRARARAERHGFRRRAARCSPHPFRAGALSLLPPVSHKGFPAPVQHSGRQAPTHEQQ